jgi:GWxTD domain-containing protein
LLFSAVSGCLAAPPKSAFDEWLKGPPSYLITRTEREAFAKLGTDAERERFISRFWEIRNPRPWSPENSFREEFYRRVAWVNSFYGKDAGTEGWRTDRGKTYILFGRPQTSMSYHGNQELYATELWFYSNPGLPELPPFFYVLFYERDGVGGYRMYNPAAEGPESLMRARPAREAAYRYLRGISPELARATLSLIPGEPVDTQALGGSLESQGIVNAIQGYRETPGYVAVIRQRAAQLERVTSRVDYDLSRTSLLTFVTTRSGESWLHWRLEVHDPKRPKAAGGKLKFEIQSQLYSRGKLVLERTGAPEIAVPANQSAELAKRPFVFEDFLPVVDGGYQLVVKARNVAAGQEYEARADMLVQSKPERAALSDLLLVERHERDARGRAFQFGGVKFHPNASGRVAAGPQLVVLYEIAAPEPQADLEVEYLIGSVSTKFRKSAHDKVSLAQADSGGSLLTAKTLAIDDLSPGAYRLVVRVKDPKTGWEQARSVGFSVIGEAENSTPVVISPERAPSPVVQAATAYERALCWLAQGKRGEAVAALRSSVSLKPNPAVQQLLDKLQ